MVREFKLLNENGQEFSFMDIKNLCLLTDPKNLGISYSSKYEKIGNTYVENSKTTEQGKPNAKIHFINYDNFKKFVDFTEASEKLILSYKIPFNDGFKEYFRDVNIREISKTEIQENGILSENITFETLSLWYEKLTAIYEVKAEDDEMRWDFTWDSKFSDYDTRCLKFINNGHIEASIEVEFLGAVQDPYIELYVDGELIQTVTFNVQIQSFEKLLYSSKENDFYIKKQNTDGTFTNLFSLDVIDFENDNVIRLPKNKSVELRLKADNDISNAKVTIHTYYKVV